MSTTHGWDDNLWDDQPETTTSELAEDQSDLKIDDLAEEKSQKPSLGGLIRTIFFPAIYLPNYVRSRVRETKEFYLNNAVPKDEDQPLQEGSVAEVLMATPWRKLAWLVVAVGIGACFWMLSPL